MADDLIRSSLLITIEEEDDGQRLVAQLLGYTIGFGIEHGEPLEPVIDDLARHIAENAEADRWIGGEGWREYRS